MKKPILTTGLADLVQEYHSHLFQTAGLARGTCNQRLRYAKRLLRACGSGPLSRPNFRHLNAPWLLQYALELKACCQPRTVRCHLSAVRSFVRFLILTGRAARELGQALPAVRTIGQPVGHYLSRSELRRLLAAFDAHRPAGRRDHAMALLAARLGLRAREIAQLSLEDVNWQTGSVEIHQTKGRRSRLLPLPADAGQAMANYLRAGRASAPVRQLFLCLHRPRPLSAGAVSDAIAAAFKRAGLAVKRPGPHLLRHTLATHLVQRGASLKAVADVLGHRSINTTTAYTKVNLTMLAKVARPWPKEGR